MTAALRAAIGKEARALVTPWLAGVAAVLITGLASDDRLHSMAPLAYGLSAMVLGAWSIGHEYAGHTLTLLLVQPIARRQLFAAKFGIAALVLLALAAVAWPLLLGERALSVGGAAPPDGLGAITLLALPVMVGLCLAPVLTMACRGPLGGVVFTVALVGLTWTLGSVLADVRFGPDADAVTLDRFRIAFLAYTTLAVCGVAAAASWRLFARLEALDGRGRDLDLPTWSRRAQAAPSLSAPPRNPLWQLLTKELHLQQMTIALAAVYVLWWVSLLLIRPAAPQAVETLAGAVAMLFGPLLALLAGSIASAEERQFGTLEWQLLLPVAAWAQWTVKAGTALGLSMLLGVGLPMLLLWLGPGIGDVRLDVRLVLPVMLIGSAALYVSSLSTSGVRALLLTLPVAFALLAVLAFVLNPLLAADPAPLRRVLDATLLPENIVGHEAQLKSLLRWLMWLLTPTTLPGFLAVPLVALVLRFALVNHRSAERPAWRLVRQGGSIAASLAISVVVVLVVSQLAYAVGSRLYRPRAPVSQGAAPRR